MFTENFDELFQHYIDVCNKALEANRGDEEFYRAFRDVEDVADGAPTSVMVFDEGHETPVSTFAISIFKGRVNIFSHAVEQPSHEGDAEYVWRITTDYLRTVTNDPKAYIDAPKRLDWDWVFVQMLGR